MRRTERSSSFSVLSRESCCSLSSRHRATLFYGVLDSNREPCLEIIALILAFLFVGVSFCSVMLLLFRCSWRRASLETELWTHKRNNLLSHFCCCRRSRSSFVSFTRILCQRDFSIPLEGPPFTFFHNSIQFSKTYT